MHGNRRPAATPRASAAVTIASALLLVMACADRQNRQATVDSDLSRDLQLASQVATQPTPTFHDTALVTKPAEPPVRERRVPRPTPRAERRESARPAIAPVAAAPEPTRPAASVASAPEAVGQIVAGTGVSMSSNSRVCTETSRPGDKIVATVTTPTAGSNGAMIPAGSKVVLEVASITPPSSSDPGQILFRVRSLYMDDVSRPISGEVSSTSSLERVKVPGDPNGDRKKVIGGAVAGAILGQILGHSTRSTVMGAATGAAAGAVAARAGERYEGCLPEGTTFHLTLSEPVVLQTANH